MITKDKLEMLVKGDIIEYRNGNSIHKLEFIESIKVYIGSKKLEYYIKSIKVLVDDNSIIWLSIGDRILEMITLKKFY